MLTLSNGGRRIDGTWIWQGVSLTVRPGDRLALTGPSGSGKTLLLRTLAGLDRLDAGQITFQDRTLAAWVLPTYRTHVTYLPQTPAFVPGTVEDNLRLVFGFEAHRGDAYDAAAIRQALEDLGQPASLLERDVDVLSGGEQQLAALLRILQFSPTVLLLDEPTANVDAERTRQVEALVDRWREAHPDAAVVWTSHDADQLQRVTDRQLDLAALKTASS